MRSNTKNHHSLKAITFIKLFDKQTSIYIFKLCVMKILCKKKRIAKYDLILHKQFNISSTNDQISAYKILKHWSRKSPNKQTYRMLVHQHFKIFKLTTFIFNGQQKEFKKKIIKIKDKSK
jgi:hypothetical protein